MSEMFSLDWVKSPFDDAMKEAAVVTRRATMYTLRATGRGLGRIAKGNAPVYSGSDQRAAAESGNLKRSIKNARRMDIAGDVYQLKMGPMGSKKKGTAVTRHGSSSGQVRGVPLYRSKMEEKYGYMASAVNAGDATIRAIYEDAMAKALAKFR